MKESNQVFEKTRQLFAKKNILFLLGVLGILFIGLSEVVVPKEKTKQQTSLPAQQISVQQTEEMLEKRIEVLAGQVHGAGKVQVMVTCENAGETIYALDESTQSETIEEMQTQSAKTSNQSTHVFNGTGQNADPLIETQLVPQVQGVAVVCEGANSAAVARRLTEMIATVFNIPASRVCVVPMQQKP